MKKVTIELTCSEVKAIYRALGILKRWDEEQLQRDLLGEETKKRCEMEMETCMILLDFDGAVYEAWKEAQKETI